MAMAGEIPVGERPELAADSGDIEFAQFVALHQQQLTKSGVPGRFWERLFDKLKNSIFDAGNTFSMCIVENLMADNEKDKDPPKEDNAHLWKVMIIDEDGISHQDPNQIYLIDHAWTFQIDGAKMQLKTIPGLLDRMANLMGISVRDREQSALVELVFQEMWKYNQTYHLGNPDLEVENTLPIWYIMDEFGSRIQHSDTPNFRTVPFFYSVTEIVYTLLFPIEDVEWGGEVTRNYIEGPVPDDLTKKALLIPWYPCKMIDVDCDQQQNDLNFLQMSIQTQETLPSCDIETVNYPDGVVLKVFSMYEPLNNNLTHSSFELVQNEDEADILWLTYHFKDFKNLSESFPFKMINQFPYENRVTVKDLLCVTSRLSVKRDATYDPETLSTYPSWLPTTFNLKTELPQFVSYFQQREERNLDNIWICKPWNLARSLDTHVTNNLNYILRLPSTGPKIACKYIENPVLFYRNDLNQHVKFDVRYIVLLCNVKPLKICAYKRFWLRFANLPFSLDDFDVYEKHFTVMNYNESELLQMFCHDFIRQFEDQNVGVKYSEIEEKIFNMIKEVFVAATSDPPPKGIAHNVQSRAMYAIDLMLHWQEDNLGNRQINPMLLEINWMPDCERACAYYPDFFNDVFSVLFLDEIPSKTVCLL